MSAISELIRDNIIATRPPEKHGVDFSDTSSLVDSGILDSVGVFTLVAFLEQHFGIQIRDEELVWKNFESVAAIAQLMESKLAVAETG
jgi:acyl carrier protein